MNRLLGSLAFFFFIGPAIAAAKPPLEELSEQIHPVPANVRISVRNTDGTIYVYASEGNELRITSRKRAYSQERLRKLDMQVKVEGDTATIETTFPPVDKGLSLADRSGTVDYLLIVPQTCSITDAELARGEIILEGLRGPAIHARLGSGRLVVRNSFSEKMDVAVAEGLLDLYYDWWEPLPFAVMAEIARGHLRLGVPSDAALRIDAASGDGNITNKFASADGGKNDARTQQITLGDGSGSEFRLRAAQGNIDLNRVD